MKGESRGQGEAWRGKRGDMELVVGKEAIAPSKLAGTQAGWGICVTDMSRVLKCSHLWEENLVENQLILFSIQYKHCMTAVGWEKWLGEAWEGHGGSRGPAGGLWALTWSREHRAHRQPGEELV